jgi:hypothetical protein
MMERPSGVTAMLLTSANCPGTYDALPSTDLNTASRPLSAAAKDTGRDVVVVGRDCPPVAGRGIAAGVWVCAKTDAASRVKNIAVMK